MSGAEVFQYIDGDTFVHKLNPLVKMLFSVFVIVAGVINGDLLILSLLVCIPIIALVAAGMAKDVIKQGKMLLVVFAVMVLITVLTVRSGEMYSLGGIGIASYDGIIAGVLISLRLAAMFFSFLLLVTTTRPGDLVNTLVSRVHFPMDYALMIMITMRFIPTLQIEARKISEAQAVRGFKPAGTVGHVPHHRADHHAAFVQLHRESGQPRARDRAAGLPQQLEDQVHRDPAEKERLCLYRRHICPDNWLLPVRARVHLNEQQEQRYSGEKQCRGDHDGTGGQLFVESELLCQHCVRDSDRCRCFEQRSLVDRTRDAGDRGRDDNQRGHKQELNGADGAYSLQI